MTMRYPKTLPAFSQEEKKKAHELLATKVAFMMGRKFEEGDWSHVYCTAKGIPNRGWSNLNLDIVHNGLGVEHKMLRPNGDRPVTEVFGMRLMHPSATRSIRVADGDADSVMKDVLAQYAEFLEQRRQHVRESCPGFEPDMRTGWLLWQSNLRDFVYFEEETLVPDPKDYTAEWHENKPKGARKPSKSLWIYEKQTRQKRYSVTTDAGAKIQPYFDVPPASDPNIYVFRVQGEEYRPGLVRVWVPATTARELKRLVGELTTENLENLVRKVQSRVKESVAQPYQAEEAQAILFTSGTYSALEKQFPNAVSDAHRVQLLIETLQA